MSEDRATPTGSLCVLRRARDALQVYKHTPCDWEKGCSYSLCFFAKALAAERVPIFCQGWPLLNFGNMLTKPFQRTFLVAAFALLSVHSAAVSPKDDSLARAPVSKLSHVRPFDPTVSGTPGDPHPPPSGQGSSPTSTALAPHDTQPCPSNQRVEARATNKVKNKFCGIDLKSNGYAETCKDQPWYQYTITDLNNVDGSEWPPRCGDHHTPMMTSCYDISATRVVTGSKEYLASVQGGVLTRAGSLQCEHFV